MSKQAMELALEALTDLQEEKRDYMVRNKLGDPTKETNYKLAVAAIDALKEAIKQHDAEPVAWRAWDDGLSRWDFTLWPDEQCNEGRDWEPLYLSAPSIPEGWQPIDTAPKDGTEILVYTIEECLYVVSYDDVFSAPWRVRNAEGINEAVPTHWMPLPASPQPTNPIQSEKKWGE